jgi:hypothetical protein
MLTLEQIAEGRRLLAADRDGGACASDCLEVWLRMHAEALLETAEAAARQKAWHDDHEPAAFARNELAAGERLARVSAENQLPCRMCSAIDHTAAWHFKGR